MHLVALLGRFANPFHMLLQAKFPLPLKVNYPGVLSHERVESTIAFLGLNYRICIIFLFVFNLFNCVLVYRAQPKQK